MAEVRPDPEARDVLRRVHSVDVYLLRAPSRGVLGDVEGLTRNHAHPRELEVAVLLDLARYVILGTDLEECVVQILTGLNVVKADNRLLELQDSAAALRHLPSEENLRS